MGQKKENRNYKKEYQRQKEQIISFTFSMQINTNKEIIEQIEKRQNQGYSKVGYLKSLIRYDIDNDILSDNSDK